MKPGLLLAFGLVALSPACSPPGDGPPPAEAPPGTAPPAETPPPARPAGLPPPVSGGTLLVLRDGVTAIAADPDRDRVYVVDVATRQLLRTVVLQGGDEPGRLAEDGARRVHVALRGAGALATIDVDAGAVADRRPLCGAPRGVAYDGASGLVHVACASGELVSLPAAGGAPVRRLALGPDLRDVIVQGDRLLVSRMRGARLLEIDAAGAVLRQEAPPVLIAPGIDAMGQITALHSAPSVAWRTVGLPGGGAAMVHTRAMSDAISEKPGGYGGGPCKGGIVNGTVSVLDGTSRPAAPVLIMAVLPVDLAISRDGTQFAVVDAGRGAQMQSGPVVATAPLASLTGECAFPGGTQALPGQITAVAFDGGGRVVVQSREPAALFVLPSQAPISLSTESRKDAGHELFHMGTRASLACASCHPEGGEDGQVWTFAGAGPRRTQTLRGGILGTEPFHWSGDLPDLTHLAAEVMTRRMMGPALSAADVSALGSWLDGQPRLPAPPAADAGAAARGGVIFHDALVGCASCHNGAKLTSNRSEDVSTGGLFQVPSLLGIAYRAPFMHTGCAPTLRDRFGACGGGDAHGKTAQLSAAQIDDLSAYLGTL